MTTTPALSEQIQAAQSELEPQFSALRKATGALKQAAKLAAEAKPDALTMQKALAKLQQAEELLEDPALHRATQTFANATQAALDSLAFEFAHDLRDAFAERGIQVEGRPPTLVIGDLVLQIDIGARKATWFYGKEALTRPLPLTIKGLLKAYDQQYKTIINRELNAAEFMAEVYKAWSDLMEERSRRGGRVNIVEVYSKLTLNRQSARFWNSPARSTFKDYPRPLFVRDLVLVRSAPVALVAGQEQEMRLGIASKNQADSAQRSVWLPISALDGEYYADLTFQPDS